MIAREKRAADTAPSRSLREAILHERIKEAESLDRVAERRSSELARLEILEASLEQVFHEIPQNDDRFELILTPGKPARLWIDMFTHVVMDRAARSYRLIWNSEKGRKILAESDDVAEICERVMDYVAGQIVARERQLAGLADFAPSASVVNLPRRWSAAAMFWAFALGLLAGACGLFLLGYFLS